MNKVIIEIPQFMDITIRVKNIREAISQLLRFEALQHSVKSDSVKKNKTILGCGHGTVKIKSDLTEPMIPENNWKQQIVKFWSISMLIRYGRENV